MKTLQQLFPRSSQSFIEANKTALEGIAPQIQAADTVQGNVARSKGKRRGAMNLTEYQFERLLKTRFPDSVIRFEAYKLRIADRCHYCPDFAVIHLAGLIDFFECKGRHIWEDSKIKFKAAKEMFPQHHFEMWQCKKGDWSRIL